MSQYGRRLSQAFKFGDTGELASDYEPLSPKDRGDEYEPAEDPLTEVAPSGDRVVPLPPHGETECERKAREAHESFREYLATVDVEDGRTPGERLRDYFAHVPAAVA